MNQFTCNMLVTNMFSELFSDSKKSPPRRFNCITMQVGNIWRIVLLLSLIVLAQLQISISQRTSISSTKPFTPEQFDAEIDTIPFDLSFPIINKSAPEADVKAAEKHLKLPVWSNGYVHCDSPETEVSCYEIVRASKAIKQYEKAVLQGSTKGQVYVDAAPYKLEDRMSMLYHALQIGIATNREVQIDKHLFPFQLPDIIKDSKGKISGTELPSDYQFGCANVGQRFPKLLIANITWPQALYTHHIIAPFLRDNFGFHAAYFMGNYLFGTDQKPNEDCLVDNNMKHVVEVHKFKEDREMMKSWEFPNIVKRCGILNDDDVFAITNDEQVSFPNTNFQRTEHVDDEDQSFVCNLRRIVSAEHVVHTFGSRYGFWGAAMQGRKGGFVNSIDKICVNMTNSQCGSLWHTFCPEEKKWIFRTNNRMFVCGPNVNDVRLYIEYLLW